MKRADYEARFYVALKRITAYMSPEQMGRWEAPTNRTWCAHCRALWRRLRMLAQPPSTNAADRSVDHPSCDCAPRLYPSPKTSIPEAGARPEPPTESRHREHYRSGYSAGWSDGRKGEPMQDERKCVMFFGPEMHEPCGGFGCEVCAGTGEKPLSAPSTEAGTLKKAAERTQP